MIGSAATGWFCWRAAAVPLACVARFALRSVLLGVCDNTDEALAAAAEKDAAAAAAGGGCGDGKAAGAPQESGSGNCWQCDHGGLRAHTPDGVPAPETYFLGVIDILQEYDLKKKLEHEYKAAREKQKGKDPNAISAVKSSVYSKRFVDYLSRNIELLYI